MDEKTKNVQPVNDTIMSAVEQKLVDDTIHPNRPADELQRGIISIAEDEVIAIEARQTLAADAAGKRGHVVDIGFGNHGRHGFLDAAVRKFAAGMFFPDGFEVEERSTHQRLKE